MTAAAREAVPRDKVLLVGAGEESTRCTIAAVKRAAAAGADAVLVRTPSYFKNQMTTELFVRHFTAVADASPVPVLLYNVPGLTGVKLAPEAVARLSSHPNIPGVKDSSADLTQIASGQHLDVVGEPVEVPAVTLQRISGSAFLDRQIIQILVDEKIHGFF